VTGSDRKRRGLVLGSGGVLGAAWTVGALCVLEQERGLSCVDVDAIVGTSAGSMVAAYLAGGVTPEEQCAHQRGQPRGRLAEIALDYTLSGIRPAPWLPPFGSPQLMAQVVRRPRDFGLPPFVAGLVPRGRSSFAALAAGIEAVLPEWPSRLDLRIVAMDFLTGERRACGGPAESAVSPAIAVTASCAVPGLFEPVAVDGRTYVDGGVRSNTSADLLADHALDEVYVVAPMAHLVRTVGRPSVGKFLLRHWRLPQTARILGETAELRRSGVEVTLLAPTAEDLEVLGLNPMDPARRLDVLETAFRTTRTALRRADRSGGEYGDAGLRRDDGE